MNDDVCGMMCRFDPCKKCRGEKIMINEVQPVHRVMMKYRKIAQQKIFDAWKHYYKNNAVCRHCQTPVRNFDNPEDRELIKKNMIYAITFGPKYHQKFSMGHQIIYYICHKCTESSDEVYSWPEDSDIVYKVYFHNKDKFSPNGKFTKDKTAKQVLYEVFGIE